MARQVTSRIVRWNYFTNTCCSVRRKCSNIKWCLWIYFPQRDSLYYEDMVARPALWGLATCCTRNWRTTCLYVCTARDDEVIWGEATPKLRTKKGCLGWQVALLLGKKRWVNASLHKVINYMSECSLLNSLNLNLTNVKWNIK